MKTTIPPDILKDLTRKYEGSAVSTKELRGKAIEWVKYINKKVKYLWAEEQKEYRKGIITFKYEESVRSLSLINDWIMMFFSIKEEEIRWIRNY